MAQGHRARSLCKISPLPLNGSRRGLGVNIDLFVTGWLHWDWATKPGWMTLARSLLAI